jgi:hypothetical protein
MLLALELKGNARPISDLDLCFFEIIPINELAYLEERFENSDFPFTVDPVDGLHCNEDFKELIKNDLIKLNDL